MDLLFLFVFLIILALLLRLGVLFLDFREQEEQRLLNMVTSKETRLLTVGIWNDRS